MKHIFTIHSHLTFLVALAVVDTLMLDKNDVILLTRAKYKVPVKGFLEHPDLSGVASKWYEKFLKLNAPRSYDDYISKLCGGNSFTAYVDLMGDEQKILITHPKCTNFHFIEEGTSTYQVIDDLDDLTWNNRLMPFRNKSIFSAPSLTSLVRILRGYNIRLLSVPYLYTAFTNFERVRFFSLSDNAFYNAPKSKKVIVRPDITTGFFQQLTKGISLTSEVVWVDGSGGRYTGLDESYYHSAIKKSIPLLKQRGVIKDKVYVKLRRGENAETNFLASELRRQNVAPVLLDSDVLLEVLYLNSKDCDVVGMLSSSLEYAHIFGHRAYTIYSQFEKQPPTFFDRMTGFLDHLIKV